MNSRRLLGMGEYLYARALRRNLTYLFFPGPPESGKVEQDSSSSR